MPRLMLSDELWSKLEKILVQQAIYLPQARAADDCGRHPLPDARGLPMAGPAPCLWTLELGLQMLQYLVGGRKLLKVFNALVEESDVEWLFIDGTYVKAHQHSAGAASSQPEAIGKSREGLHEQDSSGRRCLWIVYRLQPHRRQR